MSTRSAIIKFGAVSVVLLLFTLGVIVVFGQMRFDRTNGYAAVFRNASGLREGQLVRASGVEVGKVSNVDLIDGGTKILVRFNVERSLPLYQSTTASIRYQNLVGDRYLELQRGDSANMLSPGATIPIERTQPALDLDTLTGAFRPLFRSLDPAKVNEISQSIITVFQGQGGTVNDVLDQIAQLTSSLADRDQAIGDVANNLTTVLNTTVKHHMEFDDAIQKFHVLIAGLAGRADPLADATTHINDAAGTVGDLLADLRPILHDTIGQLENILQPMVDQLPQAEDLLNKLPGAVKLVGQVGGIYGDFFNFYLCDLSLKLNGLQPGGPVRTVKLATQPSGRCTPQ